MALFMEEEVKRGMALLDEKSPGWERKIDPDQLDVGSYFACPLGRVYGSYARGMRTLGLDIEGTVKYGFLTLVSLEMSTAKESPDHNPFPELYARELDEVGEINQTWRSLLADRLASPV